MLPTARAEGAKSTWDKDDAGAERKGAQAAGGADVGGQVARGGLRGVKRGQEGGVDGASGRGLKFTRNQRSWIPDVGYICREASVQQPEFKPSNASSR